jgi:hypothetical protein
MRPDLYEFIEARVPAPGCTSRTCSGQSLEWPANSPEETKEAGLKEAGLKTRHYSAVCGTGRLATAKAGSYTGGPANVAG